MKPNNNDNLELLEKRIKELEDEVAEERNCVLASIAHLNKMVSEIHERIDKFEE